MMADTSKGEHRSPWVAIGALGVVFGDIGTSPLYAFKVALAVMGSGAQQQAILGILSLIIWSLILIIAIKYALLIMRADNDGEGGVMAMLALLRHQHGAWLTIVGIVGAALLYGDGAITPAISVLSALEGVTVGAPSMSAIVVPGAIAILVALFVLQARGAERIGRVFGPIMLVWFAALAILGVAELVKAPQVLGALSPFAAVRFAGEVRPAISFAVVGAVFLAVTGGEAMYADMGQFGRGPIRLAWFAIVMPALLLNYLGQGAVILRHPDALDNPFYGLAPGWAHYPLIALSTVATIIASQAIISGVFSLTRQAMQLGFLPRLTLKHISDIERGQVYVPIANLLLAIATLAAILLFRSSSALAGAYGIAVSGLMAISTFLAALVARQWRYPLIAIVAVNGAFLAVDLLFFAANAVKIVEGGWYPLILAIGAATIMLTWARGASNVEAARAKTRQSEEAFARELASRTIATLEGSAAFLSAAAEGIPLTLTHNVRHNRVRHERILLLSVLRDERPHTSAEDAVTVKEVGPGLCRVTMAFGFMDKIDVPGRLAAAIQDGLLRCEDPHTMTYFIGHETLIPSSSVPGMAAWRERLFVALQRSTVPTATSFGIPPAQAVTLGLELPI